MYKFYTLKNGLKIIAERKEGVNSVSVGVMIQNGSRDEDLSVNGISHFIEHMMFKGTEKRTSKEIAESIENLGGQINAYTSKEATCYYIKNLYSHLDLSIEVLSDMILNSNFSDEEIEKEKGVVIEEINMTEDTPEDVLFDLHSEASFGEDSLAYPILGTIDRVKSFNSSIIKKYVNEKYTPYNSVISVCGRFEEKELLELVEKYFGAWTCEKAYEPVYKESSISVNTKYSNKEIEQLHINLGLPGLRSGDKRGYALVLLSNIFGGGASSILFQRVREELGLCYNIYCYPQSYQGIGILNIYAGLGREYGVKALEAIMEELKKFVIRGITEEELRINKEKIKANYILGLESTSSKMFSNAKQILFRKKITTEEEVLEKIDKITMEDINYVLKNTFGKGILNTAYVGSNIDYKKLNDIVLESKIAYDEGILI